MLTLARVYSWLDTVAEERIEMKTRGAGLLVSNAGVSTLVVLGAVGFVRVQAFQAGGRQLWVFLASKLTQSFKKSLILNQ